MLVRCQEEQGVLMSDMAQCHELNLGLDPIGPGGSFCDGQTDSGVRISANLQNLKTVLLLWER